MDIDKLEAGRELDALVAEKVMGWEIVRVGYYGQTSGEWAETSRQVELEGWLGKMGVESIGVYAVDIGKAICRWLYGADEFKPHIESFHPSADIVAAWEVMEKLRNEPNEVKEEFIDALVKQRDEWSAANDQSIEESLMFNVLRWLLWYADVSFAICRAALSAVEKNE